MRHRVFYNQVKKMGKTKFQAELMDDPSVKTKWYVSRLGALKEITKTIKEKNDE